VENQIPKIFFYGNVLSHSGYGTAARAYIHALHDAATDMSVISTDQLSLGLVFDPLVASCMRKRIIPQLHLWHAEPNDVMRLKKSFPRLVVLTTWETDLLPSCYVDALNRASEIWVPSVYNSEVFQRQLKTRVFVLPHPAHAPTAQHFDREAFNREAGLPDDSFVFVSVGTWQERKNLPGVIEAFLRAFPDEPKAHLIIKTSLRFMEEKMVHEQIAAAVARAHFRNKKPAMARIRIYPHFLPEERIAQLAARTDCYISLHRSEGWCYPLFDAACSGTPVISTGYSGPMDYLDARCDRLVRYKLIPASQAQQKARFAFDSTMSWAEPDIEHAAMLMRDVYEHRQEAKERAAERAPLLRERYSMQAIGRMAAQRLTHLAANLPRYESAPAKFLHSPSVGASLLTTPGTAWGSPSPPSSCN
jgi:glycosyltransferase involved in cell wall biosynthesis